MELGQRFFRVMVLGFHHKLDLPPALCHKLQQHQISDQAVIKSSTGTWKVRVARDQQGLISFTNGWPDFACHNGLSYGDFVVFEHTGNSHFDACIFDRTALEKPIIKQEIGIQDEPKPANPSHVLPSKTTKRKSARCFPYQSENPLFSLTMYPSHGLAHPTVNIPQAFWRLDYLRNKTCLILRDPCGREWTVELLVREKCRMTGGWYEFYVDNKLKDDDVCVFELSKESVRSSHVAIMDVKIFPAPT